VRCFLDALYRPKSTYYQVFPDAASETGMAHIPLAQKNQDLHDRLDQLRRAPQPTITVNIHFADRTQPRDSGFVLYSYDTGTGGFTAQGIHEIGDVSPNMWMTIRHWPNGTRLVNLRNTWIEDSKDNIFHLRRGEQAFRFAIAIAPLTSE
jgi:hypothetical protein